MEKRKGKIVIPVLPHGEALDFEANNDGDDLGEDERRALHDVLTASWKSAEARQLRPASVILDELRRRR